MRKNRRRRYILGLVLHEESFDCLSVCRFCCLQVYYRYNVIRYNLIHVHNAHLQAVILDNNRSLSRITTWAFLKECNMASTAALQVQVREAGGLQRRQAGTAFADLLSAMEALPEAFLAGKSWVFITKLHVLNLWVNSCLVAKVTRT